MVVVGEDKALRSQAEDADVADQSRHHLVTEWDGPGPGFLCFTRPKTGSSRLTATADRPR